MRPALSLRGGGGFRDPRWHRDARALAAGGQRRGDRAAHGPRRLPPGRDASLALVPRRPGRRDDAGLRHAGAERHLLVPALEEDLLARRRRDRPDRSARLLRRRAGRGGLMAYDEELADRIRTLLGDRADLTEQKMFGGLAFLIGGNMAIAASGQGGILVRVDPEESDELVAKTPAEPMEMRGRSMAGWLRVDTSDVAEDAALAEWVERGTVYVASLPRR